MARELDSEMLRGLTEQYRQMADGELLALAAKPDDLMDMAQQALRGEMAVRKLKAADTKSAAQPETGPRWAGDAMTQGNWWAETSAAGAILGHAPEMDVAPPDGGRVQPGEVSLTVFHDAIEAGQACSSLDEDGLSVRVEDVAKPRDGMDVYASPPVALSLIVAKADRARAMAVLREKMGLFPLQEVEEADPVVDDGTVSTLGSFGRREDAAEFEKVLDDARIWHRLTANPEGSAETEDAWVLEVREIDLVKAGDVVERAMG